MEVDLEVRAFDALSRHARIRDLASITRAVMKEAPHHRSERVAELATQLQLTQDEATAGQLRELIAKGAMGFTFAFHTDDIQGLFESLKAHGVTDFTQEPTEHFYGTDMGVRDPFGNQLRIIQPPKAAR